MGEQICHDYHKPGLPGYIRDTAVLGALVHLHLPEVHLKMEAADVPVLALALDHFITLTAKNWPIGAAVRLWDLIFLEGTPAVFGSFLALLELYALPSIVPTRPGDATRADEYDA